MGFKLWKTTLFIVAFFVAAIPVFFILFVFCLPAAPQTWIWLVYTAISVVIGAVAGVLVASLEKVGVCLSGAALGGVGAMMLNTLVLCHLTTSSPELILYGSISVLALVGAGLAYVLHDHILIISTSLCGAYGAVRAVSAYLGGYPNEFTIAQEIEDHTANFTAAFYIYIVIICLLTAGGIVCQYKHRKDKHAANKGDNYGVMPTYSNNMPSY